MHGYSRRPRPATLKDVVTLSTAGAPAGGSIEVVRVGIRQHVWHQFAFLSRDVAWLAPAATVMIVLPLFLAAYGVARAVGRPLAASTVLALLVGVVGFGALLPIGSIAWWAAAMLATGGAVQVARWSAVASPETVVRRAGYLALLLGLVLGTAAVSSRLAGYLAERGALASLPRSAPRAPNVLVFVLDTVRSASLGLYGYDRPTTPQLERWAQSATVFDNAMSTAPWTLPSHASIFTGRLPHTLGVGWLRPLDGRAPTVAEAFRDRGYVTGGFAGNLIYTSYESGLDRGFVHYEDYPLTLPMLLFHTPLGRIDVKLTPPPSLTPSQVWASVKSVQVTQHLLDKSGTFWRADEVTAAFQRWQASVGDRPFFAFINLFDAHGPYRPGSPTTIPEGFYNRFANNFAPDRDRYDAAIGWLDAVLGRTLESLQRRGVLDNTILVVTSDHGEQFAERHRHGHGNSLYLPALHVPLMIRAPGRAPAGVRVSTTVSLINLPATLLDLADITGHALPGHSLADAWRTPGQPVLDQVVSELTRAPSDPGELVSRFDGQYQYIADDRGQEELYDLRTDSNEPPDLSAHADMQSVFRALRDGLTYPWRVTTAN